MWNLLFTSSELAIHKLKRIYYTMAHYNLQFAKHLLLYLIIIASTTQNAFAGSRAKANTDGGMQAAVTQEEMRRVYNEARTPYKYGLVIAPADNSHKIDCPTVFRENGVWYMTYVCYNGSNGTNGRGYETWLAKSDDLLHWQTVGRALAYGNGSWDENQRGGFPALIDYDWGGTYNINRWKGSYWMTYIGGSGTGYETVNAPLSIGLASTKSSIAEGKLWSTESKPILSHNDKDAQWWERMTQYKSTVYETPRHLFGSRFIMFYNAGGKDATHPKGERIGIALSDDMRKWRRYKANPVFAHDTDGTITGDAQLARFGSLYVMFYFSAFNPTREYNAYNTFAASRDLVHWTDWQGEDLIVPSKPYDNMFAHKSCVVKHGGIVYHYYCAVNTAGQRGIAVATSVPMGQSEVRFPKPPPTGKRYVSRIDGDWLITFKDSTFRRPVPFNLDDYYGTLQKQHGNLHGQAMFSKTFKAPTLKGKEYFLRFEGVGTYAEISLNGQPLGRYDIGRTTQTINITRQVRVGEDNLLEVKVSHPDGITDMPWVCGGCSSEWGFSEGSQPFGIFRPVVLEVTDPVRIEPFGTHVWNNTSADSLFIDTEIKNYSQDLATFTLTNKVCESNGKQVARITDTLTLQAGESKTVRQATALINAKLWSTEKPYLYNLNSIIKRSGKTTDDLITPFGVRTASWPLTRKDGDNRFLLNGKPVFINGVCEYEHMLGQSHAFSDEQIEARVKEVKDLGFNAFRDAHQPHNLKYQELIDKSGLLWWPQFSAHIWFDTPQFRQSFKRHLVQWVKERRNSPSIILWGLQNESTLPKEFAAECANIIRSLDPTCGTFRLITTCNGGEGTDWNVVQNWSGTYGGNIEDYAKELCRADQLLNGEYGAWRTFGNHTGTRYTEERQCDILERKMQLAESVRDSVCGQFLWPLQSHDNPGRKQADEGLRRIDKVGPFNYKGLLTAWEQPVDAYYLYKSRNTSAAKEPVVYIVPNISTDSVRVYSNCEKVMLQCGLWQETKAKLAGSSLFKWCGLKLNGGLLTATAYHNGVPVCADSLAMPDYKGYNESILKPEDGYNYLYRLNCGGDEYTDSYGSTWLQDGTMFSCSWAEKHAGAFSPYLASQTSSPLLAVSPLFRTSRYGRHELSFHFPLPAGTYRLELYFIEPWYGRGASETSDYEGFRLFDVAVDDSLRISDLDLWAQSRFGKPYKRRLDVRHNGGPLTVSFPSVKAGQAIISAIAIASRDQHVQAAPTVMGGKNVWADFDKDILVQTPDSLLPPRDNSFIEVEGKLKDGKITWSYNVGVAKVYTLRFRYHNPEGEKTLHVRISDNKGVIYKDDDITFVKTVEKKTKRRNTSITTGTQTNAGNYKVTLSGEGLDKMLFDKLTIE